MNEPLLPKRRVLLADDSVTIQKVVNLTFADEDIEVVAVSDGDAAMQKFAEIVPDLVMADVNMPGANGYRICESIKQNEETKHIPVILLVGSFEPFDEALARRVGADDFLTKPFQSIRLLVNKVSDLLEAKAKAAASADSLDDLWDNEAGEDFDSADASIENLGEAGMDDEMIQTAQLVGQTDEVDEYESEPIIDADTTAEPVNLPLLKQPNGYRKPLKNLDDEDDWAKSPPLSKEELKEITAGAAAEKSEPLLAAEDLDLLEFPKLTPAVEPEPIELHPEIEETPEKIKKIESEIPAPANVSAETSASLKLVSPELIEMIVSKAVEKISSDVVKEVVREVIAQMEKKSKGFVSRPSSLVKD